MFTGYSSGWENGKVLKIDGGDAAQRRECYLIPLNGTPRNGQRVKMSYILDHNKNVFLNYSCFFSNNFSLNTSFHLTDLKM